MKAETSEVGLVEVRERHVARFWEKVDKRGPDECWPWIAGKRSHGYGEFHFDGMGWAAHRWMLVHIVGVDIPSGMECDHLCRNRACVNPAHIELVSHKQNVLRGDSPTSINARRTHCKNGHLLTATNRRRAQRGCLLCYGENDRKYRNKNREAKAEHNRAYQARNRDAINKQKRKRYAELVALRARGE